MSDTPKAADAERRSVNASAGGGAVPPSRDGGASSLLAGESRETIPVLEETLTVTKRRRSTGKVRIATRTDAVETVAEVALDRYRVEVTRVPMERVVAEAPAAWVEGDTTIIPVVEERVVMVKQLVIVEEVRIRHVMERQVVSQPVTLRRQRAIIERLDADGRSVLVNGADATPGPEAARTIGESHDDGPATAPEILASEQT